jgi:lipoprotein NlpD
MRSLYLIFFTMLLIGCSERRGFAPVAELKWQQKSTYQSTHTVKRGETLYAIAFRYNRDYRQLAIYNHLRSPYALRVGQVIRLQYLTKAPHRYYAPVKTGKKVSFVRKTNKSPSHFTQRTVKPAVLGHWVWPLHGKVVGNFIPEQGKKGIDIAGKKGDLVRAAASGVVAYSGSGLSGYGNLIIIKHDGQFLTAYGNNYRNRVVEGQKVKAGQIIAEIGIVDRKFWGVHFEIRKAGQPVNPMSYLQ